MATSFPLVIASSVFAVLSLIAIIVSIVVPSWYVVQTEFYTTYYGVNNICIEDRNITNKTCHSPGSEPFVAVGGPFTGTCAHTSGEMGSKFSVFVGLLATSAALCAVAALILSVVIFRTCCHRRRFKQRESARKMPNYQAGDVTDDEDRGLSSAEMIGEQTKSRMTALEIGALFVLLGAACLSVAPWVMYVSLGSWLYCGSRPCDFLGQSGEVTVCEASLSYVFAIAAFSWLAAIIATALMGMRWLMLKVCPFEEEEEPEVGEGAVTQNPSAPNEGDATELSPVAAVSEQGAEEKYFSKAGSDDEPSGNTPDGEPHVEVPEFHVPQERQVGAPPRLSGDGVRRSQSRSPAAKRSQRQDPNGMMNTHWRY